MISFAKFLLVFGVTMAAAETQPVIRVSFDRPSDSADGLPVGWRVVSGDWRIDRGELRVDALDELAIVTFGDPSWENYEIEVSATFVKVKNDSRWLAIVFRAASDATAPWSQFPVRFRSTSQNGTEFAVRVDADHWDVRETAGANADSRLGRSRRLKVVVRGSSVQGYLDGRLVIDSGMCVDRRNGCVGLSVSGCVARFDDVTVRRLASTPPVRVLRPGPCEVVAHRGFSAVAPENTLAAIERAIRSGADGCEFDVRASRDGKVVLMHDETVDRTTNGHGEVSALTLAELKRLDAGSWKHSRYAGEPIPTLPEALARLKGSACRPIIEIKAQGIAAEVVRAVRNADMLGAATVIAFSQATVREVREREPRLPCAWLCGEKLRGTPAERAAWVAAEARKCGTTLVDLDYRMLSPEMIAQLHRRGLTVWTWTVDQPQLMKALIDWGIRSITTNRPDVLVPMIRKTAGPAGNTLPRYAEDQEK